MSDQPDPTVEDLGAIADQVWSAYLDPEGINPLLQVDPEKYPDAAIGVCASLSITGAWDGHVMVSCSDKAARNAAAALLMMEVDEVSQADIVDATGELVNIVGGNIKSILPSVCVISLPNVATGAPALVQFPSSTLVCELAAVWMDEPVRVSLWQCRTDTKGIER